MNKKYVNRCNNFDTLIKEYVPTHSIGYFNRIGNGALSLVLDKFSIKKFNNFNINSEYSPEKYIFTFDICEKRIIYPFSYYVESLNYILNSEIFINCHNIKKFSLHFIDKADEIYIDYDISMIKLCQKLMSIKEMIDKKYDKKLFGLINKYKKILKNDIISDIYNINQS
jgi:hypothetical protein